VVPVIAVGEGASLRIRCADQVAASIVGEGAAVLCDVRDCRQVPLAVIAVAVPELLLVQLDPVEPGGVRIAFVDHIDVDPDIGDGRLDDVAQVLPVAAVPAEREADPAGAAGSRHEGRPHVEGATWNGVPLCPGAQAEGVPCRAGQVDGSSYSLHRSISASHLQHRGIQGLWMVQIRSGHQAVPTCQVRIPPAWRHGSRSREIPVFDQVVAVGDAALLQLDVKCNQPVCTQKNRKACKFKLSCLI